MVKTGLHKKTKGKNRGMLRFLKETLHRNSVELTVGPELPSTGSKLLVSVALVTLGL